MRPAAPAVLRAREQSDGALASRSGTARVPAGTQGASVATEVLRLQRHAGNRVVLARLRAGAVHPTRQVRNPFEDPSTSAAAALKAYLALPEEERRRCVKAADKKNLARVLAALSTTERLDTYRDAVGEIGRIVQEEETRAALGMTDDQIATVQMKFVKRARDEAAVRAAGERAARAALAAAKSLGKVEVERRRVPSTPARPPDSPDWPATPEDELAAWTARANKAVKQVVDLANATYPELGLEASDFELELEQDEDGAVASSTPDGRAAVGRAFVRAAELDPAYVMHVVVHELLGHPEYPSTTSYLRALYAAALDKLPDDVALLDRDFETHVSGYTESEIRATMRDLPYYTKPDDEHVATLHPDLRSDPNSRMARFVGEMRRQWSPTLVVALLRGFRMRQAIDPRIAPDALQAFDDAVLRMFDAATLARIRE
jgi:hypothetical protein